jgi:hypothetical protein
MVPNLPLRASIVDESTQKSKGFFTSRYKIRVLIDESRKHWANGIVAVVDIKKGRVKDMSG